MEKLADAEAKGDVTAIVQLQAAIKFNGGGHLNHSIFWKASPSCTTDYCTLQRYDSCTYPCLDQYFTRWS